MVLSVFVPWYHHRRHLYHDHVIANKVASSADSNTNLGPRKLRQFPLILSCIQQSTSSNIRSGTNTKVQPLSVHILHMNSASISFCKNSAISCSRSSVSNFAAPGHDEPHCILLAFEQHYAAMVDSIAIAQHIIAPDCLAHVPVERHRMPPVLYPKSPIAVAYLNHHRPMPASTASNALAR